MSAEERLARLESVAKPLTSPETDELFQIARHYKSELRQSQQREAALREEMLRRDQAWVDAEKFDRQYENSRLPGDAAMSALLLSCDERLAAAERREAQDG